MPYFTAQGHEGIEVGVIEYMFGFEMSRLFEHSQIKDKFPDRNADSWMLVFWCAENAIWQVLNGKMRLGGDRDECSQH
jgi:hypothetical protein